MQDDDIDEIDNNDHIGGSDDSTISEEETSPDQNGSFDFESDDSENTNANNGSELKKTNPDGLNGYPKSVWKEFKVDEDPMPDWKFSEEQSDDSIPFRYVPHSFKLKPSEIDKDAETLIFGAINKSKSLLTKEEWFPTIKGAAKINLTVCSDITIWLGMRHNHISRCLYYCCMLRGEEMWWGPPKKCGEMAKEKPQLEIKFDSGEMERYSSYANTSATPFLKKKSKDRLEAKIPVRFQRQKLMGIDLSINENEKGRTLRIVRLCLNSKSIFCPPPSVFERHIRSIRIPKGAKQRIISDVINVYLSLRLFVAINVSTKKLSYIKDEINDKIPYRMTPMLKDHENQIWGWKNQHDQYVCILCVVNVISVIGVIGYCQYWCVCHFK